MQYSKDNIRIFCGDSAELIPQHCAENSVDLIATDSPYGIFCLQQNWDKSLPDKKIWQNCFSALKPGGFLLAMGATRMFHRLACDIEDCGFILKDCFCWIYNSGFPRGKNLSKEIDRKMGLERKVVGKRIHPTLRNNPKVKSRAYLVETLNSDKDMESWDITEPACEESKKWEGWNTSLKTAWEPILIFAKPIEGTYAENVLKYNVGGINIDECRIPYESEEDMQSIGSFEHFTKEDFGDDRFFSANSGNKKQVNIHPSGRYPSNLVYFDSLYPGQYDKFFMVPKPSGAEKCDISHSTVKPVELFHRLVKMFSPKPSVVKAPVLVLDPFVGSGTTALACVDLGRDFIGFDIDEKNCEEARNRIDRISKPTDIFNS